MLDRKGFRSMPDIHGSGYREDRYPESKKSPRKNAAELSDTYDDNRFLHYCLLDEANCLSSIYSRLPRHTVLYIG